LLTTARLSSEFGAGEPAPRRHPGRLAAGSPGQQPLSLLRTAVVFTPASVAAPRLQKSEAVRAHHSFEARMDPHVGIDGIRRAIADIENPTAAATAMSILQAVTDCWREPLEDDGTVVVLRVT
jgi:hypothetical protein